LRFGKIKTRSLELESAVRPDRSPSVPSWVLGRDQGSERERVGEVQPTDLAGGEFGVEQLAALEAAVCCPLRRHNGSPLGRRLKRF
jgi:hypothetical protein